MDKLAAITVFLQVVDSGSFAKASDVLGLSATTTSRLVQALEDDVGARLLHRSTRRLSLTEAGEKLQRHYAGMLRDLAAAEAAVSAASAAPAGLLRVSLPHTFATRHMMAMLRAYQADHPAVELDVSLSDSRVDLVKDRIDVALRIARALDSELVARPLATIRLAICAAPAYLARQGTPATPAQLREHQCLVYTENDPPDEWRFDGPAGTVVQRVPVAYRSNNGEMLREAALSGAGIIVQPEFLVGDDLRAGTLVRVLEGHEPTGLTAWAIYLDRDHMPGKVRSFVDFLARAFAAAPAWEATPG